MLQVQRAVTSGPMGMAKHAGAQTVSLSDPPTIEDTWDCIIGGDLEKMKSYLTEHASFVVNMVRRARECTRIHTSFSVLTRLVLRCFHRSALRARPHCTWHAT